ncbi:putative CopG-family DNA-binding protein [Klebsiella pneumoniae]|nr:putative CopG-family DNA-binding protein [Klebsiella pneumoniae]
MSMMAERDMGRILLDLSDDVIQRLDDLKVQRNIPRAELLGEPAEFGKNRTLRFSGHP